MAEAQRMKRVFTVALSLCVVSCAHTPRVAGQVEFDRAMPFCEMMANWDKFVDREVLVGGLYIDGFHGREIYGEDCYSIALIGDVNLPHDPHALAVIKRAERQIRGARIPIVAKAVLRRHRGPGIAETQNEFWLESAQIIAADGTRVQRPPA